MPLREVKEGSDGFGIVVRGLQGDYVLLKAELKPYRMCMFDFEARAGSSGAVGSLRDGNTFHFKSTDGVVFYWLGDLKFASAQSIANGLAAELARVGKNDYEWLRRMAREGH